MTALRDLAKRLALIEKAQRNASSTAQLGNSSFASGAIEQYGPEGQIVQIVGTQPDDTYTQTSINGPTPPTPTAPTVQVQPIAARISWDGQWLGGAVAPLDLARIDVYVVDDVATDPLTVPSRGSINAAGWGDSPIPLAPGTYFAYLVAWTQSGKYATSAPSDAFTVLGVEVDLSALEQELAGLRTDLTAAQDELALARTDIDANAAEIVAAEQLISDAQTAITNAEGMIATLQGQMTDLNTALSTAQDDITNLGTDLSNLDTEVGNILPITETKISDDAISSAKIQANAITAIKILAGAIITEKLAAGSVIAEKLSADSVTAIKILAGSIITEKLATDSVTSDKIVANAITADKIIADAITAVKVAAGAITTDKLAADSVTADKIITDAITAVKIAAGAITTDKLAAGSVIAEKIGAGQVTAEKLYTALIEAGEIYSQGGYFGSITAGQIESGQVTAALAILGGLTIGTTLQNQIIQNPVDGFLMSRPSGEPIVHFPTDPQQGPFFGGDAVLQGLTTQGRATFDGDVNSIAKGSTLRLEKGTVAPSSPPLVSTDSYRKLALVNTPYNPQTWSAVFGLEWDGNKFWGATSGSEGLLDPDRWWVTSVTYPGDVKASMEVTPPTNWARGVSYTRIGTTHYIAYSLDSTYGIARYSSAGALLGTWAYPGTARPVLGTDGVNLYSTARFSGGELRLSTHSLSTGAITSSVTTDTTVDPDSFVHLKGGSFDYGSFRFLVAVKGQIQVFNAAGQRQSTQDFVVPSDKGIAWVNSHFVGLQEDGWNGPAYWEVSTDPDAHDWTIGYSLYDSGSDGAGTFETSLSPIVEYTQPARTGGFTVNIPLRVDVSGSDPDAPDSTRLYIGSTLANMRAQDPVFLGGIGKRAFTPTTVTTSGPLALTVGTFPDGESATLTLGDGSVELDAQGTGSLQARVTSIEAEDVFLDQRLSDLEMLTPSYADGGSSTNTTSTSYGAVTSGPSLIFVAPPSGRVRIDLSMYLRSSSAGVYSQGGFEVRTGSTPGSGTIIKAAIPTIVNSTSNWMKLGGFGLVSGLTPDSMYSIRPLFSSNTSGTSVSASYSEIMVTPST